MRMGFVTGVVVLWIFSSPAWAQDILVALLQADSGEESMHYQTAPHENCLALLDLFRSHRDTGTTMYLTFLDPVFTGIVLDVWCVERDSTVRGVDGIVELLPEPKLER